MGSFVKTVVGGALAILALYAVGKATYQLGKEVTQEEARLRELQKNAESDGAAPEENEPKETGGMPMGQEEPAGQIRKPVKFSVLLGVTKLLQRKDSVLRNLVKHPEAHKIEAYIEGEGLRINVQKRPSAITP